MTWEPQYQVPLDVDRGDMCPACLALHSAAHSQRLLWNVTAVGGQARVEADSTAIGSWGRGAGGRGKYWPITGGF